MSHCRSRNCTFHGLSGDCPVCSGPLFDGAKPQEPADSSQVPCTDLVAQVGSGGGMLEIP